MQVAAQSSSCVCFGNQRRSAHAEDFRATLYRRHSRSRASIADERAQAESESELETAPDSSDDARARHRDAADLRRLPGRARSCARARAN